jgi:hypothetical protein
VCEGAAPLVFKGAGFDPAVCFRQTSQNFLRPASNYPAPLLRQPEGLFRWDEFDGNVGDERF